MAQSQGGPEIERLIQAFAKLPGLGPRSARRAVLQLIKKKETLMQPLSQALEVAIEKVGICSVCGNVDTVDPCGICQDTDRENKGLCVVEDVSDLWALERAGAHQGRYHVVGGTLSAIDGIGPEDLNIAALPDRLRAEPVSEVVLAMNATVDGQTTCNYILDLLEDMSVPVTRLAQGVPMGGELNYLDDGTLAAAMKSRRPMND